MSDVNQFKASILDWLLDGELTLPEMEEESLICGFPLSELPQALSELVREGRVTPVRQGVYRRI